MAQKNICFYSKNCEWSKAFLKEVVQTPFKNQFNFICVDPDGNGKRPPLPNWLKKVPTLVIQGDTEPIKTDAEVMNWLYIAKMRTGGSVNSSTNNNQQPMAAAEPEAWMSSEMGGGLKDSYGFIDGESNMISHNFETIGGPQTVPQGPGTRTSSEVPGAKKTQKEELFDKQMEEYMRNRAAAAPQQRPRQ